MFNAKTCGWGILLLCILVLCTGCKERLYDYATVNGDVKKSNYECHYGALYYYYLETTIIRDANNDPVLCETVRLTEDEYKRRLQ